MISNVDELIGEANKIQSTEDRVKFIMNYFLENVKYNYANLFCAYLAGNLKGWNVGNLECIKNNIKKSNDSEYALYYSYVGESRMIKDIEKIRNQNDGGFDSFITEIEKYIKSELESHLNNKEIVNENAKLIMNHAHKFLDSEPFELGDIMYNFDILYVLHDLIQKRSEIFPPEFSDGLITNGVCEDYTNFLLPLLEKVGVEAHAIEGSSELNHAWVIIKDGTEFKSIDLTRAVFIRDGFKGIPKDQTSQDWLYHDVDKGFEMQPTRSITKIDGHELPIKINGNNYTPEFFGKVMHIISKEQKVSVPKQTDEAFEQEEKHKEQIEDDEFTR